MKENWPKEDLELMNDKQYFHSLNRFLPDNCNSKRKKKELQSQYKI